MIKSKYVKILLKHELSLFVSKPLNDYEFELFNNYLCYMYMYDKTKKFYYREKAKRFFDKFELYQFIKV